MNLTGNKLYSSEVKTMRNPNMDYREAIKKLVFVYPLGIDQTLAMKPMNPIAKGGDSSLGDTLRAFFSISILKEIFTSNTLNLITLASTYDRFPKRQDTSKQLINSLLQGNISGYGSYGANIDYGYRDNDISNIDQHVLQSKIDTKVKEIKQLLKTDHRLKRIFPFMQVITLQNMLDVPVIVGTWPYQLDTAAVFTFVAAAIATRTPLSDWSKVRNVFSKLNNMPPDQVFKMFQVLQNIVNKPTVDVPALIGGNKLPGGISTRYEELQNYLARTQDPSRKQQYQTEMDKIKTEYAYTAIGNLKDTKMKELERAFMGMLDPDRVLKKYGLSQSEGQASFVKTKVTPQTDLLFNRTKQQFVSFFAGSDVLFSSAYMLFSPAIQSQSWSNTYLSMKEEVVNRLMDNYDKFFSNLRQEFDNKIANSLEDSSLSIQNMKKSCDVAKEEFVSTINYFQNTLSSAQVSPTFKLADIQAFSNAMDKITGKFSPIHKNCKESLKQFFGIDNMARVSSSISSLVDDVIDGYFTSFNRTGDPTNDLQAKLFAINIDMPNTIDTSIHQKLLRELALSTKLILETVFLLIFKLNLCDFVEVAELEFDIASNDVLDLPNYCLILPLEVIQALFVLHTKRNWQEAVVRSGQGFNPLNIGYIKGALRIFVKQLGIPNLIVVDSNKNEIYYSFKYQSNNVEKLKLSAVETFVKHHLQNDSTGVSQVYY